MLQRTKRAMSSVKQVIKADLTWTGERFEKGLVVVVNDEGKISGVHEEETAGLKVTNEMKGEALMPGFVNCHSHAFQIALRGKGEEYFGDKGSFWTWREAMYQLVQELDDEAYYQVVRRCFQEMRDTGITSVGEFHYFHHSTSAKDFHRDDLTLKAASDVGLRIVLLNAFYQYAGFGGKPLEPAQKNFETTTVEEYVGNLKRLQATLSPTQSLGIVAHSVRAVASDELTALSKASQDLGLPFHLHIEEQPAEVQACLEHHSCTPMSLFSDKAAGLSNVTAVHCNHTKPEELAMFAEAGGIVCICPLTEGNLGDGIMPELSACKGRICLGSDCNARIDMLEEARLLEYSQRLLRLNRGACLASWNPQSKTELAPVLMSYLTSVGAKSLNLQTGAIEKDLWADFVSIDLSSPLLKDVQTEHLAPALIFGCGARDVVSSTCVGGKWA
eukprot:TRINITY_DN5747_c0_g2_i1.p1 TRINITY_DN5747_c0_g2~~TRINITY_DN5747_c0_g2_i1.p1  ORF type:complete len:444 (+),score=138.94 TRINITY_DN5747_c0_g2_i1:69-1400(+)